MSSCENNTHIPSILRIRGLIEEIVLLITKFIIIILLFFSNCFQALNALEDTFNLFRNAIKQQRHTIFHKNIKSLNWWSDKVKIENNYRIRLQVL